MALSTLQFYDPIAQCAYTAGLMLSVSGDIALRSIVTTFINLVAKIGVA